MNTFAGSRIVLVLMTVVGLFGAIIIGSWVAKGNMLFVGLILGGIFGALIFLTLGRMYWYAIPFALAAQLPAIPLAGRAIDSGELTVLACTAIFVARVAMKRDHFVLVRYTHIPILLFFSWICIIWSLNPTGLSILGSETMGGKYYFKIVLAFCSFIIVSSQLTTEKDFVRCMLLVTIGAAANAAFGLVQFFFGGSGQAAAEAALTGDGYTWHQMLAQPAILFSALIFSRFKPTQIIGLQRPGILALYILTIVAALISGKRVGLTAVLLAPLISAVIFRQYRFAFILGGLGAFCLGLLIAGHGTLYSLPYTAQRALSWLPGEWDPELSHFKGGSDTFREELRKMAVNEIRENPIIGRGYALSYNETITSMNLLAYGTRAEDQYAFYAVGRAWHNRWLGYAADFGIPLSVLLAIVYATGLTISFRLARALPHPSGRQFFAIFAFMWILRSVLNSHTSGHTALDSLYDWWLYGLLFSLYASTTSKKESDSDVDTNTASITQPLVSVELRNAVNHQ